MYAVIFVVVVLFDITLGFTENIRREYFIAAEEVSWDYAPLKSSETTEEGQKAASFYLERGKDRIGSVYKKAVFVEYSDDTYSRKKSKRDWLGFLGPIIKGDLGETLVVHFKNKATRPYSLHPHGVFYDKGSEGFSYDDGFNSEKRDDGVDPGGNHTYYWHVTERDAPAQGDSECLIWTYSSTVDPIRDVNSGLIGPLVTCKKSKSFKARKPVVEFVLLFNVIDENKSWYIEENIQKCWDSQGVNRSDVHFTESNRMHNINGFSFGNLPGLKVCLRKNVRWYIIGGGVDIHTVNFHGQSLTYNHHRVSSVGIYPSQFATVTMTAQNKGRWLIKCQVHNHFSAGMKAFLNVQHCRRRIMPYALTGKIRRYYIAAQEKLWDYAPSGMDLFDNQALDQKNSSSYFFKNGPNRIGGKYKKAVFVAYTDTTFRREELRPKSQRHLGILGPVIRGEVGDLIKVVFRNRATRPYSIHPQGVNYNKFNEGASYNDDTRDVARADDLVEPGKTKTYYWTMTKSMAPTRDDPDCLTHMYTSGVNPVRDTYSGLIGPMLVCKRGTLDRTKPSLQKKMDKEYFLLFSVFDENQSWYLDDTIDQFIDNPKSLDRTDGGFKASNRMHSVNGFVYGNLEGLEVCTGDQVSWHVLSQGSDVDIHSIYWHGHTVLEGGNRRSTVTVQPGSHHTFSMEADKEGDWALVCQAHEHFSSGMRALFHSHQCGDGYRHKKDLSENTDDEESNLIPDVSTLPGRVYYIAAEEVSWEYVTDGLDVTKGEMVTENNPSQRAYHFTRNADGFLGTTYRKVIYQQYTDEHFSEKIDKPQKELIGPMIKGEVGDVIRVVFRNSATRHYSIHAQGVSYNKSFEGSSYLNTSWLDSGIVAPGQTFTYVWDVLPTSGPGDRDPDCITYMYYSGVDVTRDTHSGLIGPLVICRKGSITGAGERVDSVKDYPLLFAIFDENLSWYLEDNIRLYGNSSLDKNNPDFINSNKIPSINGLSLGCLNIPVRMNDTWDWYLMAIGAETDVHSIHFHGHTFILSKDRKHRRDTIGLFPGTTETIRMKLDNPGDWLIHCHVNKKEMIGMEAIYYITQSLPDQSS